MAQFTVDILSVCAGNNHVTMNVTFTHLGVTRTVQRTFTKADLAVLDDIDPDDVLLLLLRSFVKESGLSYGPALVTAIEEHLFKV